jgi:hypothetical protein
MVPPVLLEAAGLDAGFVFLFWAANTLVAASPRIIADTKINLFIVYLRNAFYSRFLSLTLDSDLAPRDPRS